MAEVLNLEVIDPKEDEPKIYLVDQIDTNTKMLDENIQNKDENHCCQVVTEQINTNFLQESVKEELK